MLRLLTLLGVLAVGAVAGAMVLTGSAPAVETGDVADGADGTASTDSDASDGGAVDGDSGADSETATPGESTASDGTDGSDADAATAPFAFSVDRVETCGNTCRDVTSTLTNQQSTEATNVTVETRIYAGNGTDSDPVWTDSESVGTLPAGESYTTTKRVDLSLTDAYAVERNDGWVTIEMTITSDGETVTMTERRDVN